MLEIIQPIHVQAMLENNMEVIHKMEMEEIQPNTWLPKKDGDFVEGKLVSKNENVGPNESRTYYLEKDGEQVMLWGSTVLDNRMDFVEIGDYVRITFKGTQKNTKGQDTKIFKVEREKKEEQKVTEETVRDQ